jgi:hypothetical protein
MRVNDSLSKNRYFGGMLEKTKALNFKPMIILENGTVRVYIRPSLNRIFGGHFLSRLKHKNGGSGAVAPDIT